MSKIVFDPSGIEYKNAVEMCKAYGLCRNTYKQRKHRGWTLEECLYGKKISSKNGGEYKRERTICHVWGLNYDEYLESRRRGKTVAECLREAYLAREQQCGVMGARGECYDSVKTMCEAYGTKVSTYNTRKKAGLSLDICLSPIHLNDSNVEHWVIAPSGAIYTSVSEMCEAYGVPTRPYTDRIATGYSKEEALELCGRGLELRILRQGQINPLIEIREVVGKRDNKCIYECIIKATGDLEWLTADQIACHK